METRIVGATASPLIVEGSGLSRLDWPDAGMFWLTAAQLRVVRLLLLARRQGRREVSRRRLLAASRAGVRKLGEVFVGSGMWGVIILPGKRKGHYRLAS